MNTRLNLYVYVDGINDIPFYGDEYLDFILVNGDVLCTSSGDIFSVKSLNEQITVGSFKYSAQRMGSAPSITFTLRYPSSLDGLWNENIYAIFNGKKYFLKQTPSSSIINSEEGYSYEVELIDERVILDNTYFFDATENPNEEDKPVSNGTKFNFFGDVHDFADRLNKSLLYSGIQKKDDEGVISGYRIVVDEGISSEEKLISFDNKFFSEALNDVYNTFQIPYYFVGEVIHFGHNDTPISEVFKYGIDNALLSIKMDNANSKVVNRATAIGSSDNIPYYYPNNSPKGTIRAVASDGHTITMLDTELYANSIAVGGTISFHKNGAFTFSTPKISPNSKNYYPYEGSEIPIELVSMKPKDIWFKIEIRVIANGVFNLHCVPTIDGSSALTLANLQSAYLKGDNGNKYLEYGGNDINLGYLTIGTYELYLAFSFGYKGHQYSVKFNFSTIYLPFYINDENGEHIQLKEVGLRYEGGNEFGYPNNNMVITQELVRYVQFADNLMPPKYRNTYGKERFYNATNDTYVDEEGQPIVFVNPYTEGHPKEDIFEVEDIKPTIKEVKNALNQRIDMFSDIAYDENDSDEVYTDKDGNTVYKHPHFFAKLRKLPFNLFEHAIEGAEMTISITSGDCGACSFRVKVDSEYPYSNPVQVDNNGNLVYDKNGMVLCGLEDVQPKVVPQDRQQDTINNEVWIALEKEEDTYGILMPKSPVYDGQTLIEKGYRVKACSDSATDDGDTFVILNISLPNEYILAAEEKLEKEIVKYLKENNLEKFNFTINFSRIFFAENPSILEQLDENSCIQVEYNDVVHTLYVSTFNYDMSDGESLPNISVDLSDSITVSQSALQTAISQVERRVIATVSNIDIANMVGQTFLRKDIEDTVNGKINFRKGVKFGEGASVDIDENNNTKLSVDYLQVNKKATFTSLEIQEKTHVGGQIIISPASMVCSSVEELEDSYKCFFETTSQNGSDIMNLFVVGDQAICQTFNEWSNKYYWRLVTEVGKNYISLSKSDCDLNSDVPSSGDKIIQFGNRDDNTRQSAIILSSNGDNSPSIILYNGINSFSLAEKNITGIIWNHETKEPQMYSYGSFFFGDRQLNKNFITFQKKDGDTDKNLYINGKVTIGAGSEGLSNLAEWNDKQIQINNAQASADNAQTSADNAQASANNAQASADNAQTSADNAQASADNAQNTANEAKTKAEDAQTRAGLLESTTSNLSTKITDVENNITETVEDINKRLDGVVENYFEEGVPTLSNYPANQWTTDNEKKNHIGDTYTNINTYDTDPENAGKSWRWVNTDSEHSGYHWHPIADSDAVKALQDAAKAQSTADGKSTTFLRQPTNYQKGDLWILQSDSDHTAGKKGEILTANTSSIAYNASHWTKEVIYTDDSSLNGFISGEFATYKTNIQNQIDNKAQTWYQSTDPSTQWTTTTLKNEHIGDMWLNTSSSTIAGVEAGMTAIWTGSSWESSAVPQEVFNKIDGKAQVFVSQPTTPYHVGDLWASTDARLKKCNTERLTGSFNEADWGNADNSQEYTDTINNQSKDAMAKELGYADYNDMKEQVSANGSIIMEGGYINADLIEANAIKASMIDIENLFAQHIEANDLLLKDGCSIGDSVNIEGGEIVSKQTTTDGLEYRTHIAGGRIFTQIPDRNDKTKSVSVEVGGCSGSGIMLFGPDTFPYCSIISDGYNRLSCGVFSDFSDGLSFYSPNGQMAGIRPYVFVCNSPSMKIGDGIPYWANTIIAKYSSARQTIYLPDTPQKGDWYRIINDYSRGSLILMINGNGKTIETANGRVKLYNLTSRGVLEFVYDGTEWHII